MELECYECGQTLDPNGDIFSITGSIQDYCEACHDKLCVACLNGLDHPDPDDYEAITKILELKETA